MPTVAMPRVVPEEPPGRQRDETSQHRPLVQLGLMDDTPGQRMADVNQLYALFGAMVRASGGVEALTSSLDREPSYDSKIREGMYRAKGRHVQLEWFAYLLSDPRAWDLFAGWVEERGRYQPFVREVREVSPEQINEAAREVLAGLKDDEQREFFKARIAKKLGVRPEDIRL